MLGGGGGMTRLKIVLMVFWDRKMDFVDIPPSSAIGW